MATANINSMNTSKGTNSGSKHFHGRLKVDAQFCPSDVDDLFSTVDWEVRSAQIKGENGELIFEQTNCEVASFARSPIGVSKMVTLRAQQTANASTASWPGSASISTARSTRPSGSTSAS